MKMSVEQPVRIGKDYIQNRVTFEYYVTPILFNYKLLVISQFSYAAILHIHL